MCFAPLLSAADARPKRSAKTSDMQRAIAFQRAKDRADARQARLEARHPSVSYSTNSANREDESGITGRTVKDPGEKQYQRDRRR